MQPFDIGQAVTHLKAGEKVRREAWGDAYLYLQINAEVGNILIHLQGDQSQEYKASSPDLLATDWQTVE